MRSRWFILILLLVIGTYIGWAFYKPLPALTGMPQPLPRPNAVVAPLRWPAHGQAAVGIVGSATLETNGPQTPSPTASTAKLITVLTVLDHKPLAVGQTGPTITLTQNDVNLFTAYASQGGSNVKVTPGEQLTEYQILQGILLPSSDNLADSLAIWAFGSLSAYKQAATQYLSQRGLNHTKVGSDASGLAPDTTSTAGDLVKIGELAMQNPVIASIVGQASVTGYPVVNNLKNVNWLLGTDGIVGIKTGNSDQAGGVFVSASRVTINGKPLTIVTAVSASPSLQAALNESRPLVQSAQANFSRQALITAGTVVGQYRIPWGDSIPAVASQDLSLQIWNKTDWQSTVALGPIQPPGITGRVGTVRITVNGHDSYTIPVKLQSQLPKPSLSWRLLHPF